MNSWGSKVITDFSLHLFFENEIQICNSPSWKYNCSPSQVEVNGNELFGFEWRIDSKIEYLK